jgi:hypothetical protein
MTGYGTIYQFEFDGTCRPFSALLTTKCKVLILKKDYNSTIFTIPYGQVTPIEIDYPTVDDDIFYPIKGSSLSFKVLGGVLNMDSLISEDEKDFYLEYYRDGSLFWSGFVSPELCEEDIFLKYPAIEFKTIDGLGALNNTILLDNNSRYITGRVSLLKIINAAFKSIGFGYGSNTLIDMKYYPWTGIEANGILWNTYTNMSVFKDKNGLPLKPIEIIKSICYLFNAVVYQNRGQWWFVKVKDLAFGLYNTVKYDANGVVIAGSGTVKQYNHGTDFLIVAEPKRKIRRFYRDVTLTYDYYKGPKNIDTDFSSFYDNPVFPYKKFQSTGVDGTLVVTPLEPTGGTTEFVYDYYTTSKVTPNFNNDTQKWSAYIDNTTGAPTSGYIDFIKPLEEGDTFSLSFRTISQSSRSYIKIVDYSVSPVIRYFNPNTGLWQSSDPQITWLQQEVFSASNIVAPFNGQLTIRLYVHPSFNFCIYTDFSVFFQETLLDKQLTTITNIKNTTITAPSITVLMGDYKETGSYLGADFRDPTNLKTWSTDTETSQWSERSEVDLYDIQELSARNILNQYSDYRNIFTGTIIGQKLEFGCIYNFPNQGALANKKFFPLSMKMNERDCTAEVVFMELSPNEITGSMNQAIYDSNGLIVYQTITTSKKKSRNGVGTDLGQAGDYGTIFDRFVAFFMDDFKP